MNIDAFAFAVIVLCVFLSGVVVGMEAERDARNRDKK